MESGAGMPREKFVFMLVVMLYIYSYKSQKCEWQQFKLETAIILLVIINLEVALSDNCESSWRTELQVNRTHSFIKGNH